VQDEDEEEKEEEVILKTARKSRVLVDDDLE
jgi:hypothetical protein